MRKCCTIVLYLGYNELSRNGLSEAMLLSLHSPNSLPEVLHITNGVILDLLMFKNDHASKFSTTGWNKYMVISGPTQTLQHVQLF